EEIPFRKPAGTVRVVVIGDSFTFGQGCSKADAFPDVLQTLLTRPDRPVEVVNVSNIGLGPEAYVILLRDLGLRYEPDLVVVNVYGNDVSPIQETRLLNRTIRSLSHRLHVFVFARELWKQRALRAMHAQGEFWAAVEAHTKSEAQRAALR